LNYNSVQLAYSKYNREKLIKQKLKLISKKNVMINLTSCQRSKLIAKYVAVYSQ